MKYRRVRLACVAWFACAIVLPLSAFAESTVIARYDANTELLPDQACWDFAGGSFAPIPAIDDGAVILGPTQAFSPSFFQASLPEIPFGDGAAIEASIKIEQSTWYELFPYKRTGFGLFLYDDSGNYASIGLAEDRILLQTNPTENWEDQTYPFDTTDGFHVYRLEIVGNTATVLIDGRVVLVDTVGVTLNTNMAWWGDASTVGLSTTATQYVVVEGVPRTSNADITGDGVVNGADLASVLAAWGTLNCNVDQNLDLTIDGQDLGIVLGAWGPVP